MSGPGLILFLSAVAIVVIVLVGFGVAQIRKGVKAYTNADTTGQQPVWHRQPSILLGINNFVFAILICLVVLISLETNASARIITLIVVVLIFLGSLFLVMRTVLAALSAAQRAAQALRDNKQSDKPA
jgi:uncharacterized membrane protein